MSLLQRYHRAAAALGYSAESHDFARNYARDMAALDAAAAKIRAEENAFAVRDARNHNLVMATRAKLQRDLYGR